MPAGKFQFDDIPDRIAFDTGIYLFKIAALKELETDDGILTYLGVFECEEPLGFDGLTQMERFTIGDENDPEAQEANTWRKSRGAKNFKQMLNAASVPLIEDTETLFEAAKGARFVARIVQTTSKKDGQVYGNIRSYYSTTSPEAAKVGLVPSGLPSPGSPTPDTAMTCGICGVAVPRSDYGKHLVTHRTPEVPGNAQARPQS